METPEDVAAMLRLKAPGVGYSGIAKERGCSRKTVRRYVGEDAWVPHRGRGRPRWLGMSSG